MPQEATARIVGELASRGYNAEREAVTLIASAEDPDATLAAVVEAAASDALKVTAEDVRAVQDPTAPRGSGSVRSGSGGSERDDGTPTTPTVDDEPASDGSSESAAGGDSDGGAPADSPVPDSDAEPAPGRSERDSDHPSVSTGDGGSHTSSTGSGSQAASPHETKGSAAGDGAPAEGASAAGTGPTTEPGAEQTTEPGAESTGEPGAESTAEPGGQVAESTTEPADPTAEPADPAAEPADVPDDPPRSGDRGADRSTDQRSVSVENDMTGRSTGTGEYGDFVKVFRDRYDKLASKLRGRVNHRPTDAIESMAGGSEVALVGMVNDIRSTASGHWLIELEDTKGTFPCLVMKDRNIAELVDELLYDEVIAIEGTLADDAGIVFVDSLHFPDVPRTHQPSYADRHVQAALISDVHVGSQEFMHDEWDAFCDWLHTEAAEHVEYLLIAGDMVEGVGVYPNQDEELDVVDIYEQYETFNEKLKQAPGDIDVTMIPGNHDAVRLAEPQPGFDEELRGIMSANDPRIVSNPSTVTVEGVSVLMYHGVSLDEVIAETPEHVASYDEPHKAMYQLLKKRHVAPQYGGHTRLAPEEKDYLVIEDVPDVFHTGHVHKLGFGKYHNVLAINSGCWQRQTDFQKSVNIQPDAGYAPIVDLDTLDVTVRKFS